MKQLMIIFLVGVLAFILISMAMPNNSQKGAAKVPDPNADGLQLIPAEVLADQAAAQKAYDEQWNKLPAWIPAAEKKRILEKLGFKY